MSRVFLGRFFRSRRSAVRIPDIRNGKNARPNTDASAEGRPNNMRFGCFSAFFVVPRVYVIAFYGMFRVFNSADLNTSQ